MEESAFTRLLQSYLKNELDAPDRERLMDLVKSGAYDQEIHAFMQNMWQSEDESSELSALRSHELLYKIFSSEKHAEQIIGTRKGLSRRLIRVSVAAFLLLLAGSCWYWLQLPDKARNVASPVTATSPTGWKTAPADSQYIRLPDGSSVLLNKGSRLIYTGTFGDRSREVTLVGEGYFDIKQDPHRPFIVHSNNIRTVVLGTAFNVKAYSGQPSVTVTVTRGKVRVEREDKILGICNANKQLRVDLQTNAYRTSEVNTDLYTAWKKSYLVLDNISMEEASVLIGKQYHINIHFENERLKNCMIKATFLNQETVEQILDVVTGVINARYKLLPNDIALISGEGCNAQ